MPTLEETEFKGKIAFSLGRQFRAMWAMTRNAIEQIPDKKWAVGIKTDNEWFYSLRVYHMVETAEFYSRDAPNGMQWGARLGTINWWETLTHEEAAKKVIKGDTLIYLNEIAQYLERKLKGMTDEELLANDGFHWFTSILEKYQYLIRHNTFHLGELTMQLRAMSHERIKWT